MWWYKEIIYRLGIFAWQDVLEILAISAGIYGFTAWLSQDNQKKLTGKFLALTGAVITAQFLELPTLSTLTIALYPTMLMLFILVHQTSLQKNFISLKNLQSPELLTQTNWLQTLLRSSLIAINQHQSIYCLIEGKDTINEFINIPFIIKSRLQPEFLDLLVCSSSYDMQKMIWVNRSGILLGVNTSWRPTAQITVHNIDVLELWRQNCLLFTTKTDLLAFHIEPTKRTFEIISQGKSSGLLPIDQGIKLLQQSLQGAKSSTTPTPNKGRDHEHSNQTPN